MDIKAVFEDTQARVRYGLEDHPRLAIGIVVGVLLLGASLFVVPSFFKSDSAPSGPADVLTSKATGECAQKRDIVVAFTKKNKFVDVLKTKELNTEFESLLKDFNSVCSTTEQDVLGNTTLQYWRSTFVPPGDVPASNAPGAPASSTPAPVS